MQHTRACISAESQLNDDVEVRHSTCIMHTDICIHKNISCTDQSSLKSVGSQHMPILFFHLTPICACSPSCAVSRLQLLLIFWNLKSKWMCSTEDVPLDFLERYLEII